MGEDVIRILISGMEAVDKRSEKIADNVNILIGKHDAREALCEERGKSLAQAHARIDENDKLIGELMGIKKFVTLLFTGVITTLLAIWATVKDSIHIVIK